MPFFSDENFGLIARMPFTSLSDCVTCSRLPFGYQMSFLGPVLTSTTGHVHNSNRSFTSLRQLLFALFFFLEDCWIDLVFISEQMDNPFPYDIDIS